MLLKFGCSCLTSDILLFAIMIEFPTTYLYCFTRTTIILNLKAIRSLHPPRSLKRARSVTLSLRHTKCWNWKDLRIHWTNILSFQRKNFLSERKEHPQLSKKRLCLREGNNFLKIPQSVSGRARTSPDQV